MKPKVSIILHKNDVHAKIGPGTGTYANELVGRLAKKVDVNYATYDNIVTSFHKPGALDVFRGADIMHDIIGVTWLPRHILEHKGFIATIHDISALIFADSILLTEQRYGLKDYLWVQATRKGLMQKIKHATTIITVSHKTKQQLIDICGVDRDKIFPVDQGVSSFLKPIKVKKDKFVIGTLSGMYPRKNPRFLLSAFKLFDDMLTDKERKDVLLDIHGAQFGNTVGMINDYMKGYDNFKVSGPIPQDQKLKMYNSFDVFAFPSIDEGFGIPIIEAQACGIPTIIDGNGMISKEVGEKCLKAYSDQEMADMFYRIYKKGVNKSKRQEAMNYAKKFTWDRTAEETLKVYKKVLG